MELKTKARDMRLGNGRDNRLCKLTADGVDDDTGISVSGTTLLEAIYYVEYMWIVSSSGVVP